MQYFRYKLKPNKNQKELFNQWIGSCRCLYNIALEQRKMIDHKETKARYLGENPVTKITKKGIKDYKYLNYDYQAAELSALKDEYPWFKDVPGQALQYSLRNLDTSFKRFFKGESSFPKHKKKSFRVGVKIPKGATKKNPNGNFQILGDQIKLPKMQGTIRFIKSREMEGDVKSLTISKDGDGYFVSILCDIGEKYDHVESESKSSIGIDRGIAKSIALSDGSYFDLPKKKIKKIESRIASEQIKLARKNRFSNNWYKSKRKINRLHRKITNIRQDFLWKKAAYLSKNHAVIALEDLKVRNMSKSSKGTVEDPGKMVAQKSGLNRSILREGWYDFSKKLEWQAKKNGARVIYCNPKNTSLTCNDCGHVNKANRISQSEFTCMSCRRKAGADENAARNVIDKALGTGVFSLEAS